MAALYNCKKCNRVIGNYPDRTCDTCRKKLEKEIRSGFKPVEFKK
jgi:hypothetical protein